MLFQFLALQPLACCPRHSRARTVSLTRVVIVVAGLQMSFVSAGIDAFSQMSDGCMLCMTANPSDAAMASCFASTNATCPDTDVSSVVQAVLYIGAPRSPCPCSHAC